MDYRTRIAENRAIMKQELHRLSRAEHSRLSSCRHFIQHGHTSVYKHCLAVTDVCCVIAALLPIHIHIREMIRGAMLHDYFLYDWHEKGDGSHQLHGFRHPFRACKNASEDFHLTEIEIDMIKKHMFPLVPIPPMCREAWILCIADKICSTRETFNRF